MSTIGVESKAVERTISAVITRADGRVEDLGTIGYWHRNPFRRFLWRVERLFRRV